MKVFLDTNILLSAILFPGTIPDKALQKALSIPYEAITCTYVLDELEQVFRRKFPKKISLLHDFYSSLNFGITIIKVPEAKLEAEEKIRDIKDRPVLRAAIDCHADVIITGDKDFLESEISLPKPITARTFYEFY